MIKRLIRFLAYYFRAQTKFDIHSPFVFEFVEQVLEDDRWFYAFMEIEGVRKYMLADQRTITVRDLGAGSRVIAGKERSIRSLAKYSANRPFVCRMLFRLVQLYKPATMLELGTSLGISSQYLAAAAGKGKLVTLEGCPQTAHLAAGNFKLMKTGNITLLQGSFQDKLPEAFTLLEKLDFVFFDGDHRQVPTLEYFEQCLPFAHENSVFVFDDIHWSEGMEKAWEMIRNHPKVTLSIDLYFFGVVFFRKEQKYSEHFTLIKWLWKPWAVGLGDFVKPK